MLTPFDRAIEEMKTYGYHSQRRQVHSDIIGDTLFQDLLRLCDALREDVDAGLVDHWLNVRAPGGRGRQIDMLVGEPDAQGDPDLSRVRIALENKSVMTAHRNRFARYDDLNETMQVIHDARPETIMVATVLIGTAERFLNVSDRIRVMTDDETFEEEVRPRLLSGDASLWGEFDYAISEADNDHHDSFQHFEELPVRNPAHTHGIGYDYVLLVPVFVDNVNEPRVVRDNDVGVSVDEEYWDMLDTIRRAYEARWHL